MNYIDNFLKVNFQEGRCGCIPRAIVLHITDGSFKSALNTFNNPKNQVSAHYLVSEAGEIHRLVDENDTAWHCGKIVNPTWKNLNPKINPNLYTIGIESALKPGVMPKWNQWVAVAGLVKDIWSRHGQLELVNHNEIRSDKQCPGTWMSGFYISLLTKLV